MHNREKTSGKAGSALLLVILIIITALAAGCLIAVRYRTMKNETAAPAVTAPPPTEEPGPTPEPTPSSVPTPSPEEKAAQEEAERKKAAARKAEAAKYSFYQKLEKGYDTNILVLGDSTAADPAGDRVNGIVDGPKFSGLSKYLEEKYPSKVTITNLAFPGGCLLGDALRVLEMPEEPSYDLIILSYGLNDTENKEPNIYGHIEPNQNLWPNYMALLLTLSNKFPDCSIVCTLEPCFHEINEELDGMRRISKAYYGIPVIDLVTALQEKGDGSDLAFFESDQTTLNEKGMEEWIRLLCELIDTKAEESAGKMDRIATGYDRANGVSQLSYIPVSDPRFSRRDDTSYTLDIKAEGISFIRHKRQLAREDVKVIADDMLYNIAKTGWMETPEGSYVSLLHEQLLCENSFEIIFTGKELADELEGIYLIEKKAEKE